MCALRGIRCNIPVTGTKITAIATLVVLSQLVVGCGTTRNITVTSEPSGALVYLNDEEVGRTPVTVPFQFYGTYDVRLEAEGYKPLWTTHEAAAPFWEYPGPDLVGEALGGKSELHWNFILEPLAPGEEDTLIDRSRQMRALLKNEPDSTPKSAE